MKNVDKITNIASAEGNVPVGPDQAKKIGLNAYLAHTNNELARNPASERSI